MNGSGFYKVAIACADGYEIQKFFYRTVFYLTYKLVLSRIALKAAVYPSAFIRGNDIPRLGLSAVVFV